MKRTLSLSEEQVVKQIISKVHDLTKIIARINESQGRIFLVGGAVRDVILQQPVKDLDCEVHGIELEKLAKILQEFGGVNFVGKSFGVFKVRSGAHELDISLPRTDSSGRKPEVTLDPHMSIKDALRRRDVTMNAMAVDLVSYELYDPFRGEEDLKDKVLRSPDIKFFVEDPLRFYRVMQFVGRFNMVPDTELEALCTTMNIAGVSRERIEQEFTKLLLKSERPSLGFRWLARLGRLKEILPELAATIGIEQTPEWHPEGDVFLHTMQALDAAASIATSRYNSSLPCGCAESLEVSGKSIDPSISSGPARGCIERCDRQRLILLYAVLCHDLGKVECWQIINGKITNRGHDVAGMPLAKKLLARICGNKKTIQTAAKLVRYHMDPTAFIKTGAKRAAYKRLALKLAPETNLQMLAWLCIADKQGRSPHGDLPLSGPIESIEQFVAKADKYGVLYGPEAPILKGEDLLDSIEPGPKLGELVKKAYELQINEGITDKAELKKRVLS